MWLLNPRPHSRSFHPKKGHNIYFLFGLYRYIFCNPLAGWSGWPIKAMMGLVLKFIFQLIHHFRKLKHDAKAIGYFKPVWNTEIRYICAHAIHLAKKTPNKVHVIKPIPLRIFVKRNETYTLSKAALFNRSRLGECQQFSFEIALTSQVETRYNVVISGCSVHSDHLEIWPTIDPSISIRSESELRKNSSNWFLSNRRFGYYSRQKKIAQETQLSNIKVELFSPSCTCFHTFIGNE